MPSCIIQYKTKGRKIEFRIVCRETIYYGYSTRCYKVLKSEGVTCVRGEVKYVGDNELLVEWTGHRFFIQQIAGYYPDEFHAEIAFRAHWRALKYEILEATLSPDYKYFQYIEHRT